MIDVALCMLALVAGGVTLEAFCDTAVKSKLTGANRGRASADGRSEAEFECGNPS